MIKNINYWYFSSLLISLLVAMPILTVFSSFFGSTSEYYLLLKNTFLINAGITCDESLLKLSFGPYKFVGKTTIELKLYCSKYANSEFSISKFNDIEGNIKFINSEHKWNQKNEFTIRSGFFCYCG